ncbi:MAG TPA: AI-2E family transporter [Anaeromyxobacter sp.]
MEARHDTRRAAALAAAATCGVLSVALVVFVLWRSAALLALLYVAIMMAVLLDRPVAALVRRGVRRGWALALVLTWAAAATVAALAIALGPLLAQLRALASAAPSVADRLRGALVDQLGAALGGTPLATWFQEALSRGATELAGQVYGAAGGVAAAAGALATVLVTGVLLLVSGPRLVQRAVGALPPHRRPAVEALARELETSLGGYLAGLSVVVLARVLATAAYLAVARLPFVIPLALLAGISVTIPYLGAAVRLLAVGAVVWATHGSGAALAALAFVVSYDVVENYVVSPLVYRRTLGLSALGQLVAVLFLGYHFGVVGAVLAIPLAATAQILARALRTASGVAVPWRPSDARRPGPVPAVHRAAQQPPAGGRPGG